MASLATMTRLLRWCRRLICRLAGHRWANRGRNSLGGIGGICERCGHQETDFDW